MSGLPDLRRTMSPVSKSNVAMWLLTRIGEYGNNRSGYSMLWGVGEQRGSLTVPRDPAKLHQDRYIGVLSHASAWSPWLPPPCTHAGAGAFSRYLTPGRT